MGDSAQTDSMTPFLGSCPRRGCNQPWTQSKRSRTSSTQAAEVASIRSTKRKSFPRSPPIDNLERLRRSDKPHVVAETYAVAGAVGGSQEMSISPTLRQVLVLVIVVIAVVGTFLYVVGAPTHIVNGSAASNPPSGGSHYEVVATIAQINVSGVRVGFWPQYVIYDPQSGQLYVASEFSQTVSVVDPGQFNVTQVIPTGADARGLVLDPSSHLLFVSNDYASNLTVINTTTETIQSTPDYSPYGYMVGEQLDPSTGQLLVVANNPPDSILSVNPNNYSLTRVLPIAPNPGGGNGYAINETSHVIYFPARGDDAVSEIGELNGTAFADVSLPGEEGPTSTFLDPLNGDVYVMLGGWLWMGPGNQAVALNPATNKVVSHFTLGSWPDAYAYNPTSELLYVSCAASGNISIINASTNQVVGSIFLGNGTLPGDIAIDPVTGNLFIGEDGPGTLVEVAQVTSPATSAVPATHSMSDGSLLAARWAPAALPAP
jgi:YVTN family beta-propeller protein